MNYTLPQDIFEELVKNIGKDNAEKFANAIEKFLDTPQKETQKEIIEKKENLKAELYNKLRNELATKEFVRAEINEIKAETQQNNLLLKLLIGISVFALTIFNPNFFNSYGENI